MILTQWRGKKLHSGTAIELIARIIIDIHKAFENRRIKDLSRRDQMTQVFSDNRYCFVCGEKNPFGLKLKIRMDEAMGEAETDVTFAEHFQGWKEIVHGGLLAAVLDEVMIYAAKTKGFMCVTGEMTVRYVKPPRTGTPMKFRAWIVEDKGRILMAESEVLDSEGNQIGRASGKLFKMKD